MDTSPANVQTRSVENRLRNAWQRLRSHVAFPVALAASLYTVLVLMVTYPAILHFDSAIAGQRGDTFQHLWSLWWGQRAIFDPNVALTNVSMLYFPQQLEHPIMGITPWIQIVAAPFVFLFGPIAAYNLWHLLSTVLTGVTTYLLAYEMTEDHRAAFLSGLVFAFAPTRLIHGIGHYAQIMTYLFPLYFLFLWRTLKKPALRNGLLTAVLLALSLLVNFIHIAYFVVPGTVILVGYFAIARRTEFWQRNRLLALALAASLAFLITAPLFVPFLLSAASGGASHLQSEGVSLYGADLLAFIAPSSLHPLLKDLPAARSFLHRIVAIGYEGQNITEGLIYLGLVPLALAIFGSVKRKRTARPWLAVLLISAIFSLGPLLRVNGDFVTYEVDGLVTHIVMPYALLTELPLFSLARTPARINVLTMMALAVLVSLGAGSLLARWSARRPWPLLVTGIVAVLIVLEYVSIWPYPVATTPVPDFYRDVAAQEQQFGILDYPMYLPGHQSAHSFDMPMYYQLFHNHPIAGGYIWRLPPDAGGTMRALDNLVSPSPQPDITPDVPVGQRAELLRQLGFRYIVVHKYDTQLGSRPMPEEQLSATVQHLTSLLGAPSFEDNRIVAFRVPEPPETDATEDMLFLAMGENWLEPEVSGQEIWRWSTDQRSSFIIYGDRQGQLRLAFHAGSLQGPRRVSIAVNGDPIGEIVVDEARQFITQSFSLSGEQNEITFTVSQACQVQEDEEEVGAGNPCVNLQVSNVALIEDELPAAQPIQCLFDNTIALLGYDLETRTEASPTRLEVTLYWGAATAVENDYTVFTHLRDEDGRIYAQADGQPMQGNAPTSSWGTGERIIDRHVLELPEDLPEDEEPLLLTTGLYLWPSGERLPIDAACGAASPEQYITLTTIKPSELEP